MQLGDLISGSASAAAGYAYLLIQPLGVPGLFGQALLARRTDTDELVVVKSMRADRPAEDRERFLHEARTLERLAEHEERAGRHYAVRLLDQSPPDAPEVFLVLERAAGQNVLEQIVDQVADWQHAPLDERLALEVAWQLAQALRIAHQAGICYDDMKLENLFWSAERPDDPLRIIDWNVTSELAERGTVAGDWARFGARLYELRTGSRIGVDHAGTLLGAGPAGPLWQQLPDGTRDLIAQALGMRYADDEALLRDLRREREQARLDWPALIERAQIADGAGQSIEVRAPVSRAMRLLEALPPDHPARADGLAACADLRQRAALRGGQASARALESAVQSLARNEPRLAIERFQKAYADTGSRDPRPRRWLWLAQLAAEQPERFYSQRAGLEAGVAALGQGDPHTAAARFAEVCLADPDLEPAQQLRAEALALAAATGDELPAALGWLAQLNGASERFPDLQALRAELQTRHVDLQRRAAAQARERELWGAAQSALAAAAAAEHDEALDTALRHVERALAAIEQMLAGGCSPELEPAVRAGRELAHAHLERLTHMQQIRQLPDLMNSPDPRQRRQALGRAEQLIPDWSNLGKLRKQVRQIENCFAALERARAEPQPATIAQALVALDALERMGVKLDQAGGALQQARHDLLARQAALTDGYAREQIAAGLQIAEQARLGLSRARAVDALAALDQIDARGCSQALLDELARARGLAADLDRVLELAAEQRAPIDAALARGELGPAGRMAQQLAHSYPQLPSLAGEAAEIEQVFWGQLIADARGLAAEYRHASLKSASAGAVAGWDARQAALLAQRQGLALPGAQPTEQQTELAAEAERAFDELAEARAGWLRRREQAVAELIAWLDQAERELAAGDAHAARELLAHIHTMYLADDAFEQGLDPLLARAERLAAALRRHHEAELGEMRALAAQLNSSAAQLHYARLQQIAADDGPRAEADAQALWDDIRRRAEQILRDADRVERPADPAVGERHAQLVAALAAVHELAAQLAPQLEGQLADLAADLRRAHEQAGQQLALLQAEERASLAALHAQQRLILRVLAGLGLAMVLFAIVAIVV